MEKNEKKCKIEISMTGKNPIWGILANQVGEKNSMSLKFTRRSEELMLK